MFKRGDTAYFVFRGDFVRGRYRDFFCLPTSKFNYFPFYPVEIISMRNRYLEMEMVTVNLRLFDSHWQMPTELLEKEFSFDKFILASLAWDGTVTPKQFSMIAATVKGR